MPKHKKAKTSHRDRKQPTTAEIWDDSALIRSWDDAVAEYEFYHSIHARGEDVDEVLRKAEMEVEEDGEASEEGEFEPEASGEDRDDLEEGELEDGTFEGKHIEPDNTQIPAKSTTTGSGVQPEADQDHRNVSLNGSKDNAQLLLPASEVQGEKPDQTLENIKMAYYWAGYYSGLYDGQKQQQQQQAPP